MPSCASEVHRASRPSRGKPALICILACSLAFHAITFERNRYNEANVANGLTHTHTRTKYRNPRCACVSRVNNRHEISRKKRRKFREHKIETQHIHQETQEHMTRLDTKNKYYRDHSSNNAGILLQVNKKSCKLKKRHVGMERDT